MVLVASALIGWQNEILSAVAQYKALRNYIFNFV